MALAALGWGLIAGSAVFIGALIAWFAVPSPRLIAAGMAFASGILLSVAAFDLLGEAFAHGNLWPTTLGYLTGAGLFGTGLFVLDRAGARHRKRASAVPGAGRDAGAVVALATVLDGIPEALIIGMNFFAGTNLGIATVAAVFLANMPESIASTAAMRNAGRRFSYVAGVWMAVAMATGLASLAGYLLLGDLSPESVAVIRALAGGALLVFIADSMIPEAFTKARDATGVIVALGFLAGFALSRGLG